MSRLVGPASDGGAARALTIIKPGHDSADLSAIATELAALLARSPYRRNRGIP